MGPDWERQPVRPAAGVRVAVHGLCKAQLCRLVADMMIRGKLAVVPLSSISEGGTGCLRTHHLFAGYIFACVLPCLIDVDRSWKGATCIV